MGLLWASNTQAAQLVQCGGIDDTAAIQQAVDLGDTALQGQCLINGNSGIRVPSNRRLSAYGAVVQILPCTFRCKLLETPVSSTDILIEGGLWLGDMSPMVSGAWRIGIRVDGAKRVQIRDLTLRDWYFDGIWVGGSPASEDILLSNLEIQNFHRNGISVVNAKRVLLERSLIHDATSDALVGAGVDIEPNPGDQVDGMRTWENTFRNVKVGIFDQPGRGRWGVDHEHVGNTFLNFQTHGLIVNSHQQVLVYGNSFQASTGIGISIGGATETTRAAFVLVAHNQISAPRPLVRAGVRDSWFIDNDLGGGRMETVALGASSGDLVLPPPTMVLCQ